MLTFSKFIDTSKTEKTLDILKDICTIQMYNTILATRFSLEISLLIQQIENQNIITYILNEYIKKENILTLDKERYYNELVYIYFKEYDMEKIISISNKKGLLALNLILNKMQLDIVKLMKKK